MSSSDPESRLFVLDTNAQRLLFGGDAESALNSRDRAAEIGRKVRAAEDSLGSKRLAHPWVIAEMLSHIVEPAGLNYRQCELAIVGAWEHSSQGGALYWLAESEALLAQAFYGADIGFILSNYNLFNHLARIVAVGSAADRAEEAPTFKAVRKQTDAAEDRFADDILRYVVRGIDPDSTTWQLFANDREARREALRRVNDDSTLVYIAASHVLKAASIAGANPAEDPDFLGKVQMVVERSASSLEMYRTLVRKLIETGADLKKSKHRNTLWDIPIIFGVGQMVEEREMTLVTSDKGMLAAAGSAGARSHVLHTAEYLKALRLKPEDYLASKHCQPPDS